MRYYLDYNATSPLASNLQNWLAKGEFPYGNASSTHTEGRAAAQVIKESTEYLKNYFGLTDTHYLIYHSGATEGIKRQIENWTLERELIKVPLVFFYSPTDHPCVLEMRKWVLKRGHQALSLPLNSQGELNCEKLLSLVEEQLKNFPSTHFFLNYTFVNNITGVVWPLRDIIFLRDNFKSQIFIHCDSVQAPGKIANFFKLIPEIDAYTFSGHKFGSLKGVGFTFIKKEKDLRPFRREGTANSMGIYSLKLALEFLHENWNFKELLQAKNFLEKNLIGILGPQSRIVGEMAKVRNANTLGVILNSPKAKSEMLLAALDIAGISASAGSACTSGIVGPNPTLLALGEEAFCAERFLRFSVSPYFTMQEAEKVLELIGPVLKRFLS